MRPDLIERLRHVITVDGMPLSRPNAEMLEAADHIEADKIRLADMEATCEFLHEIEAENERLRAALQKCGIHTEACACRDVSDRGISFVRHDWPCDCGLRAALEKTDDK